MFDFLYGLSPQLDDAHGRVLSRDPFPTLREAFVEVRREETRRKVMIGPEKESIVDSTVLATTKYPHRNPGDQPPFGNPRPTSKSTRPYCEHCKRMGHLKEACWKLHGRPEKPRQNQTGESKACHANSSVSSSLVICFFQANKLSN